MSVVKPQYGPTLVGLLAPRSLAVRLGAAAFAVLLVVAVIAIALSTRPDETLVLEREPVTFNFVYGPQFARDDEGALVTLRHARDGLFLDGFVVQSLELPPYKGVVNGTLPVYADGYIKGLRGRYRGFEFVGEGRTRINNGIGYQVTFRAKDGARTLYGRHYLLVEEKPDGLREGVIIEITSTAAAGTPNAAEIGNHGALKTPLRSFRFGEDREGGTA